MKWIALKKSLSILVVFTLILVFSSQAHAESVTLDLSRNSLTNVDDAAGNWQHEGGKVFLDGNYIADYVTTRRITFGGTDAQNTAMLTMTIFVIGENPPQNITLQGSHDFSSGRYIGSVSAASSALSFLIRATFSGNTVADTLTITW